MTPWAINQGTGRSTCCSAANLRGSAGNPCADIAVSRSKDSAGEKHRVRCEAEKNDKSGEKGNAAETDTLGWQTQQKPGEEGRSRSTCSDK